MASEILQAIAAGKTTIDSLKILTQYASEIKDAKKYGEFMRIIGQLHTEIAEIQIIHAAQTLEFKKLAEEIERLKKPEIQLINQNGLYYNPLDKTFPFCPNCYVKSKDYRVLSDKGRSLGYTTYCCPECSWEGGSKRLD